MNTFKGPFLLMFEDMKVQFYIISAITVLLTAFYILLGMIYNRELFNVGAIYGPFYGLLLIYPFLIFNRCYQYILSLGGTRKQFMGAVMLAGGLFILAGMTALNVLYAFNEFLVGEGYSAARITHLADLSGSSNFFLYVWVDLLWGTFLFGTGMVINAVWFRLGSFNAMLIGTVFVIAGTLTAVFGDMVMLLEWLLTDYVVVVQAAGAAGLLFLGLSYLLMKNGPLARGEMERTWRMKEHHMIKS